MKKLSDDVLMSELEDKVAFERLTTSQILQYLREVEARKLHLKMGYQSLFHFAVKRLHYSEAGAQRRVNAARLLNSLAELALVVEEKIENGSLNLTQLSIAKQVIDFKKTEGEHLQSKEEKIDLLNSFVGKTSRECQVEAAKAMGVKLPEKELRQVGPEGEERITVTLDQETVELLSKFKSLTAHKNPMAGTSEAIKLALQFAVEKMNPIESAQRFSGKIKQCETSRGISKSMRTQVFERDRGVCQYKDSKTGRKCESDFKIEVDHVVAWSRGGKSTLENLQCLCANHNQWKSCN